MATLKDLSEHTGYSIATISRILNNDPRMSASEETRMKVISAANEFDYSTTKSKKGRNTKNILNIGMVFSCQFAWRKNNFEQSWIKCFKKVCSNSKISLEKLELGKQNDTRSSRIDGILAIGVFTEHQINRIMNISQNVVFLDATADEILYDSVVINSHAGMAQAIEYLKQYDHEKIGYFGPCGKQRFWKKRILTEVLHSMYQDAMYVYGFSKNIWTLEADVDVEKSKQSMIDYINFGKALPTAIIAASMENAFGIIQAFREFDIKIPRDISVIAFCDIDRSKCELNELTNVHIEEENMCRAAIRLIIERMPTHTHAVSVRKTPKKVMIPPALQVGLSVGQPRWL